MAKGKKSKKNKKSKKKLVTAKKKSAKKTSKKAAKKSAKKRLRKLRLTWARKESAVNLHRRQPWPGLRNWLPRDL